MSRRIIPSTPLLCLSIIDRSKNLHEEEFFRSPESFFAPKTKSFPSIFFERRKKVGKRPLSPSNPWSETLSHPFGMKKKALCVFLV